MFISPHCDHLSLSSLACACRRHDHWLTVTVIGLIILIITLIVVAIENMVAIQFGVQKPFIYAFAICPVCVVASC
jgi:hypothetical protein